MNTYGAIPEQTNIFHNVTAEDNPDLAYILSFFQDSQDYMWIGTYNGVFRFDGVSYERFVFEEDTNSISNSAVHAIAEDDEHNLWFGTEYGLNKYDRKTGRFTNYFSSEKDNSLSHDHIRKLHIDKTGIIWIGTYGGGINRYDPVNDVFTVISSRTSNGNLKGDRINTFLAENDTTFWIGTETAGLCILNPKSLSVNPVKLPVDNTIIADVFKDSRDNMWIGTWHTGLFKKEPGDSVFKQVLIGLGETWTAKSIAEDIDGNLWIGTFEKGLIRYTPNLNSYRQYLPEDGINNTIVSNSLWIVFIDKAQIVWAGSFGRGFSRFDRYRHKFNTYSNFGVVNKGLSNKSVNSVLSSKDYIWLGTQNGLNKYSRSKNEVVDYYLLNNEIEVHSINKNNEEILWLGTSIGLLRLNLTTDVVEIIIDENKYPSLHQSYVSAQAFDLQGNLWFAVYDEGLFFMPSEQVNSNVPDLSMLKHYKYTDRSEVNISSNVIWDIHVAGNKEIWLATNTSIDRFNTDKGVFQQVAKYAHSSFFSNQPGVLWSGSLGQGLLKIEISTLNLKYYNSKNGFASDVIRSIEGDSEGNLWISTNKGISKLNPFNETVRNYDIDDGLPIKQFGQNSSTQLNTGQLVFGNRNGITIFQPNDIKDSPFKATIRIKDIKVLNNSVLDSDNLKDDHIKYHLGENGNINLRLRYSDNVLSFHYTALSYSGIDKVQYAYMLEGFDDDWNYSESENNSATYTNLNGGKYRFKVKASNPDGIWNEEIAYVDLYVKPPYWKTVWFKITFITLILTVIVYLFYVRTRRLKHRFLLDNQLREKEIMKLNNEKLDAELEFKKKELALSTLYNIKKNEDLAHLQNELSLISKDVIPKNKVRIQKLIKELEVSLNEGDSWAHFEQNFNVLHDDFLKRFSQTYPKLTHKDLRICAFIRMNIDNKEIARTLSITPESLGVSRTRIRKKIQLDRDIYLNDFILRF